MSRVSLIAVLAAVAGGPVVGGVVAAVGWTIFFVSIAGHSPDSVIALPLWVGTAVLVGLVSARAIASERARAADRLEEITAHGFRTPVATIHGMAEVLRGDLSLSDETREHMLRLIAEESRRLLDEELRARDG